jgi:hypothetical protein
MHASNRIFTQIGVGILGAILMVGAGSRGQDAGTEKVTVDEILKLFGKNGKQANEKFKGKTLEIVDTIEFVGRTPAGARPIIEVKDSKDRRVSFLTVDPQPWATFAKGQKVKIVGKWSEYVVPQLAECEVTAEGKGGPLTIRAEQLSKESAKGFKEMNKQYKGATLIVTGKLLKVEVAPSDKTSLTLQGVGKQVVIGEVLPNDLKTASSLKVGETVTFAGEYAYTNAAAGAVNLRYCWPIQKKE